MKDSSTSFTVISTSQFQEIIDEIRDLKRLIKETLHKGRKDLLTEEETKVYLRLSSKTLQKYRNEGKIAFSQIDRKIFYRMKDIEELMERVKVKSFYAQ